MEKDQKISINCELHLIKGEETDDEWVMGGIASTDYVDTDGESLSPSGADLEYFIRHGEVNFNHLSKGLDYIIGYPKTAFLNSNNQIEITFGLFKDKKLSEKIYEHALSLELVDTATTLGLSIEAVVPKDGRNPDDPTKVDKWVMTGVAVLPSPKNKETFCRIIKGHGNEGVEFDEKSEKEFNKIVDTAIKEEVSEKADLIEQIIVINSNETDENKISEVEIYELVNNKNNMNLKEIIASVSSKEEITPEDVSSLKKGIEEHSEKKEVSDLDALVKGISDVLKPEMEGLAKGVSDLSAKQVERDALVKGLTSEIQTLATELKDIKAKYEKIDDTPIVKSDEVDAIAKGVKKEEAPVEESFKVDVATEGGVELYKGLLDAGLADGKIEKGHVRGLKMQVQSGIVPDAIKELFAKDGVEIING